MGDNELWVECDFGGCSFVTHTGVCFSQKRWNTEGGTRMPGRLSRLGASPGEEKGSIFRPKGRRWGDMRLPSPKRVSSPEVPFVGSILDVVANIVEHAVGRGAVSGIEHLEEVHCGIGGLLRPFFAPQGPLPTEERPECTPWAAPLYSEMLTTPPNQEKSPSP